MKKLTIFTPTYNRAYKLVDAYASLIKQSCKDFVWLIIDDGSTDNTEEIVKKWRHESEFEIVYKKKKNGGKHSAYNYALNYLKTEYVYLALDSDDVLYDCDTVKSIYKELSMINNEIGLVALSTDLEENGTYGAIKRYDIKKLQGKSLSYAYTHNLFDTEARMILKSSYVKKYKYPEFKGERFFTEAYTYYQMGDLAVRWTKLCVCRSKYLGDGLTASTNKLFVNNPKSWFIYNELRMKKNKSLIRKIKYAVYYIAFGILSDEKIFKYGFMNIALLFLYPFGMVGAKYLSVRGAK